MTPAQYNRVLEACRKHVAAGGKIEDGIWGVQRLGGKWVSANDYSCSCAMGALLLHDSAAAKYDDRVHVVAARVLGETVTELEVDSFVSAFDGLPFEPGSMDFNWHVAGVRLRKKLVAEGLMDK